MKRTREPHWWDISNFESEPGARKNQIIHLWIKLCEWVAEDHNNYYNASP
jgi:hypothetical protein